MNRLDTARRLTNAVVSGLTQALGTLSEAAPPDNHRGSVWANRLGLQPTRLLFSSATWHLRTQPCEADPGILAELRRDGIAIREGFFPPAVFARLEEAFSAWDEKADHVPNKDGFGVDWSLGVVEPDGGGPGSFISELVASAALERVAAAHMRRPVPTKQAAAHYQHLRLPPDQTDTTDVNGALHSDRHFHTLKAFLYLADTAIENGPFVYARGSHRTTLGRVQHEYDIGIRLARMRAGEVLPPDVFMPPSRAIVTQAQVAAMGIEEEAICAPKNTLILCDTRGFHRRGQLSPGCERSTLRFLFHELEQPWYAPPSRWLKGHIETQARRLASALPPHTRPAPSWEQPPSQVVASSP